VRDVNRRASLRLPSRPLPRRSGIRLRVSRRRADRYRRWSRPVLGLPRLASSTCRGFIATLLATFTGRSRS